MTNSPGFHCKGRCEEHRIVIKEGDAIYSNDLHIGDVLPFKKPMPTKHVVRVGDNFRLGPWTWEVSDVRPQCALFQALRLKGDFKTPEVHWFPIEGHWFPIKDADSLSWIEEPVTCSKEFADAMKHALSGSENWTTDYIGCWLNSHTEASEKSSNNAN